MLATFEKQKAGKLIKSQTNETDAQMLQSLTSDIKTREALDKAESWPPP